MNILVTGAAGNVGKQTILQLLQINPEANITAFDLPNKKNKKILKEFYGKINIIFGDITNPIDVEKICSEVDMVIHLAAIIPPLADQNPSLANRVNVLGTRNILQAMKKYSPKAMIIYSSSISVYGDRLQKPYIRVGDALQPSEGDEYAKTKIMAENLIQNSGLDWSIFRLTAIFGIKNHKLSPLMFHMPLDTPMEIATAEDTGRAFALASLHLNELKGKIFNLSGGQKCRISYKQFLNFSFKIYGLGKLNFPAIAFATRNFHCAYYADGDVLENILHFRRDTIDSYFKKVRKSIMPSTRFFTKLFNKIIKKFLLKKSEPYEAVRKRDTSKLKRFFGKYIHTKYFEKI